MTNFERKKVVSVRQILKSDDDTPSNLYASCNVDVYAYSIEDGYIERDFNHIQRSYGLDSSADRQSILNDFKKIDSVEKVKHFLDYWGEPSIGMSVREIIDAAASIKWMLTINRLTKQDPKSLLNDGYFKVLQPKNLALTDVFCNALQTRLAANGYNLLPKDMLEFKGVVLASFNDAPLYKQSVPKQKREFFEKQRDTLLNENVYFGFCPPEARHRWRGIYGPSNWLGFNQLVATLPRKTFKNVQRSKPEECYGMFCTLYLKEVFDRLLHDVHPVAQIVLNTHVLQHKEINFLGLAPALAFETPYEAICLAVYDIIMGTQPGKVCVECGDFFIGRKNKNACSDNCRKRKSKAKLKGE